MSRGSLESLRRLCRYQTHPGYTWAGVTDDGELVCVNCLRLDYRLFYRATRDGIANGYCIEGHTHSGEIETREYCACCSRMIWDGSEE